jgi:predicted permease
MTLPVVLRSLRRSPGFTASAVATLALGIAANAAVFSVVDGVLLRPLPYEAPERLVRIWETNHAQGIERGAVGPGTYVGWRARVTTLEGVGLYLPSRSWLLTFDGEPEAVAGTEVTPGVFDLLRVRPILGRGFLPERPDGPPQDAPELVLSHALWQRRFGADPDIVGKTVMLEGRSTMTIVGVMPAGFDFPGGMEAWRQERFERRIGVTQSLFRYYGAIGRLRDGQTIDRARAELSGISAALAIEFPKSNAGYGAQVAPFADAETAGIRGALLMLLAMVGLVLLAACANVASLMLARGAARRRDIAVRVALGAGRRHLLRERLMETAVLATLGGTIGVIAGYWGMRLLVSLAPADIPRLAEVSFNGRVLACTAAVTILTAVVTTVLPALPRARRVLEALQSSRVATPSSIARSRGWLVGAQVAVTMVLLVGAALLLRSFVALRGVDLGFDSTSVTTVDLRLPAGRFPETRRPWFRLGSHYDQAMAELATVPGVSSVAGITRLPLVSDATAGTFWIGDATTERPGADKQFTAGIDVVTPGYFETMGMTLVRGRTFSVSDRLDERALGDPAELSRDRPRGSVIVNQAFADRFWPDQDPLGGSIRMLDHWAVSSSTIVGVVANLRGTDVATIEAPAIYVPWGEMPGFRLSLVARTAVAGPSIAGPLRARLQAFDPQLLVSRVRPMGDVVSGAVSRPRFNLVLVASFAILALALAAVGIHGVVAYLVVQRTREVGVRLALGALPADVRSLMMRQGLAPVLVGIGAGALVAAGATRVLRTLLFGVGSADPASFAGAAFVLGLVASVAAYAAARRVTSIDPVVALRQE